MGMTFHVHTDHKPLVPLLGSKNLDELPLWVQRFKMSLMHFSFTISHVPGRDLITADALSCAPVATSSAADDQLRQDVQAYVSLVMDNLPATDKRLQEIQQAQQDDEVCKRIALYCKEGWPERGAVEGAIKPYLPVAAELTIQDGLLLRGSRILIPHLYAFTCWTASMPAIRAS